MQQTIKKKQPTFLLLTFEIKIITSWHLEIRILTPLLDLLWEKRFSILFWLRQPDTERLRD